MNAQPRQGKKVVRHPSIAQLANGIDTESKALSLVKPYRFIVWSVFLLLIMLVLGVFAMLFVPWQQTSFGVGQIVPYDPSERLQDITAQVKGLISEWHVKEGQYVNKGDSIVSIKDIDPNLMDRLNTQLLATETSLVAAQTALNTSKNNLSRQKRLADKGLKSQRDYELAKLEYNKFIAQVATKRKELQEVKTKFARQSSQLVTAPRSGTVMRIFFPEGQTFVKDGDVLALLAPTSKSGVVELFIDGLDLPLVGIGRKVRLEFEGWPSIQFSGWPSVAVGTFGGEIKVIDPSDNGTGKFRVLVFKDPHEPQWPDSRYLRQGVRVKGWILLDTVSLGYEIWRKFNNFPKSLFNEKNPKSAIAPGIIPKDVKKKQLKLKIK